MLQISLVLMKCLNKTETPIFQIVVCSLFPIFLAFIYSFLSLSQQSCTELSYSFDKVLIL